MTDQFYQLKNWAQTMDGAECELLLDKEHSIFKGHFPEMPILPGACMVQLTHDLTDKYFERKTAFSKAVQIKFMAMVNPENTQTLKSTLKIKKTDDLTVRVEHQLEFDRIVCFKISVFYSINV